MTWSMSDTAILLDTITDATGAIEGAVVISGSHGGMFPATFASGFLARAVIFHDAGIGLQGAGVAGVMALADTGMAAAAVNGATCDIGAARNMWDRGRISRANAVAGDLGVVAGMTVAQAAALLQNAPLPQTRLPPVSEVRQVIRTPAGTEIVLLDSASLVRPDDAGRIIVTGSHGGLIGANPARALKARARIAVFNDAGSGPEKIAKSRLPALDAQGIAAVLLSCRTARIGDALSGYERGVISGVNATARRFGAMVGKPLKTWLEGVADL
jgi:hypothetical protein